MLTSSEMRNQHMCVDFTLCASRRAHCQDGWGPSQLSRVDSGQVDAPSVDSPSGSGHCYTHLINKAKASGMEASMDDGYHYGEGYIHTLYGILAGKEDQGVQDWVGEGNYRAYSVIKKYEKSKGKQHWLKTIR